VDQPAPAFRRVLFKLSGEILRGDQPSGIDPAVLLRLAEEVRAVRALGVELGIVLGGGNLFRGVTVQKTGIDRVSADQIGMLATVANGLACRSLFERAGIPTRLSSALEVRGVAPLFDRREALAALGAGEVVVFVGGTGNPYFTTDTAAALRALQIGADVLLKGTKVDGVYTADPVTHPEAERFATLGFGELMARRLGVMDLSAAAICADHRLPVIVFNLRVPGMLARVIAGEAVGTRIVPDAPGA
jgi:uridylate kinase